MLPPGSHYIYEAPLKDPGNNNYAIAFYLHIGNRADRMLRSRALLLWQIMKQPVFDSLRTKD